MNTEAEAEAEAAEAKAGIEGTDSAPDWARESGKQYPLIEAFTTIQGEGPLTGTRSHFMRFGGCPRRCSWCDSLKAVLPEEIKKNRTLMTMTQLIRKLDYLHQRQRAYWLTLTGGDPCMWDLSELVAAAQELRRSIRVNVETQGDLEKPFLYKATHVTLSPKAPSAGPDEAPPNTTLIKDIIKSRMEYCTTVKIVVFDEEDYAWAADYIMTLRGDVRKRFKAYLNAGTPAGAPGDHQAVIQRLQWLAHKMLADPRMSNDIIIGHQLHTFMGVD